jgi:hypothetical protein
MALLYLLAGSETIAGPKRRFGSAFFVETERQVVASNQQSGSRNPRPPDPLAFWRTPSPSCLTNFMMGFRFILKISDSFDDHSQGDARLAIKQTCENFRPEPELGF